MGDRGEMGFGNKKFTVSPDSDCTVQICWQISITETDNESTIKIIFADMKTPKWMNGYYPLDRMGVDL